MAVSDIATTARGNGRGIALAGVVLAGAFPVLVFALRFFGTELPVHEAEWWIGDIALASVFALPVIVAVIALRGREHLLASAAVLCFLLSIALLVSLVTLPLIVPAVLFVLAHRRIGAAANAHVLSVTIVLVVCAIGALLSLILTPGTLVCWRETVYTDGTRTVVRDHTAEAMSRSSGSITMRSGPPTDDVASEGGGCTEGVFPPMRSLIALGLVAGSSYLTWRMS